MADVGTDLSVAKARSDPAHSVLCIQCIVLIRQLGQLRLLSPHIYVASGPVILQRTQEACETRPLMAHATAASFSLSAHARVF